jgi:hypothetical protein
MNPSQNPVILRVCIAPKPCTMGTGQGPGAAADHVNGDVAPLASGMAAGGRSARGPGRRGGSAHVEPKLEA